MSPRTAAGVQSDLTTLPHRVPASGLLFPPEWHPLAWMVPDLVHGSGVKQAAIHHDPADRIAVLDVLEGIPVEHNEIGELAFLEGSECRGRGRDSERRRSCRTPALRAASCRPARASTIPNARRAPAAVR